MPNIICGGDVHDPSAAAHALAAVTRVYRDLLTSIDQSAANQRAQGVTGAPLDMLADMADAATTAVAAAEKGAAEAERQAQKVRDTLNARSLAGTQAGKYMDPVAAAR